MEGSFWKFSLEFYADPFVAGICIDLQDRHAADVNVLLFALWCASRSRSLSRKELERVGASVSGWQNEVVRPLRGVRRYLKAFTPDPEVSKLREAVKKQELEAERVQQLRMEAEFREIGSPASDRAGAAAANVELYATFAGQVFPAAHVIALVGRLREIRPD